MGWKLMVSWSVIVLLIAGGSSLVLMALSFDELYDEGAGNITNDIAKYNCTQFDSKYGYRRPIVYHYNSDPGDGSKKAFDITCTWRKSNSGLRGFTTVTSVVVALAGIISLIFGLNQIFQQFFLGSAFVTFFFFCVLVYDADQTRKAKDYCVDNVKPNVPYPGVDCRNTIFALVCTLDAIVTVIWAYATFVGWKAWAGREEADSHLPSNATDRAMRDIEKASGIKKKKAKEDKLRLTRH